MSKTYWIKKDPNCNLDGIDWIELNGIEFYEFTKSPESKGRYTAYRYHQRYAKSS